MYLGLTGLTPDPREVPACPAEDFRRRTRAHRLLDLAEDVDAERRAEMAREILLLGPQALQAATETAAGKRENAAALARSLVRLLTPDDIGQQIGLGLLQARRNYPVEHGAILISRLLHPNLAVKRVLREIETLGLRAQIFIGKRLGVSKEDVRHVARQQTVPVIQALGEFWRNEGFHGNTQDYYSDRNSYIPDVLERRTGLPIALSVVYLALARRAGLHAEGVGLPGHFIVRVRIARTEGAQYVLIDPFHGARSLDLKDCRQHVEAMGQPFVAEEHLKPTSTRDILARMCNNLLALFDHQKKLLEAERVATVLHYLQPDDPVPLLIRAERRLRRGERRLARRDFARARKLDPKGPVGRAALELLRRMEYENPFA